MTRIAILADIHGSFPALEAVLADARKAEALDRVLVAGDIFTPLYDQGMLSLLQDVQAVMIQGNGEQGLLEMHNGSAPDYIWTAKQFALSRYSYARISADVLGFISTLPEQRTVRLPGTDPIRMVHGSPRKINESIMPEEHPEGLAEALALADEPVVVFGHTHLPWQARVGRRLALNPGAVTGPVNGQVGAQYAILEWDGSTWQAELRCVSYDLGRVTRLFVESGLLDTGWLARAFLASIQIGLNVGDDFIRHAFALSRQAGFGHLPYVPDEIWEQAGAVFPWPAEVDLL